MKVHPLIQIIGITEVKAKKSKHKMNSVDFNLDEVDGYNMFSKNLDNDVGRGLLLYIHRSLEAKEITLATEFQENIFVEIKCNNKESMIVGLVYRSPTDRGTEGNNENLLVLIEEVASMKYTHKLTMGDFNLPNIDWKLLEAKGDGATLENNFLDCVQNALMFQHVFQPTRWRGDDTPHVLDLILTNDENMVDDVQYLGPLGKSDHCVLLFKVICCTKNGKNEKIRKNYNKGNFKAAIRELEIFDWKEYLSGDNVNTNWRLFKLKMKEMEDKYVPNRKSRTWNRKHSFPLDSITKLKIKEKNDLAKKAIKSNDPEIQKRIS